MRLMIGIIVFLMISGPVYGQVEVLDFDPIATEITLDEETFAGILVDEEDYSRYVDIEIDNQVLKTENRLLKESVSSLERGYNSILDTHDKFANKITDLSKRSWFQVNKGWFAMVLGFVVGAGTVALVVSID